MKIMVLAGSYWPAQDGVAHVTEYLAEGLARKHEVYLIAPYRKTLKQQEEHENVKIERIAVKRKYYGQVIGEKKLAVSKIQMYKPDILMVIGIKNWGFDWTKKILNQLPGKKVLMTHGCSCLGEYDVWDKIKKIRLRRQILADFMNVYTEWYWKKYLKMFPNDMMGFDLVTYLFDKEPLYLFMKKFPVKKEIILENAVEDFFFERKAYRVDESKPIVFINVSNYEERKNQKLLLEAYYKADIPDSRLVLIGSVKNEYYQQLMKDNEVFCEKDHMCKKAEILAEMKRKEVLERYKEADVYLAASNWEAMSISICEAAAAGLTILSTDVGHISNIPGVYFFKAREELIALIRKIYENPDLRRESGRMAYKYAEEKYRIQNKVNYLEENLLQLMG